MNRHVNTITGYCSLRPLQRAMLRRGKCEGENETLSLEGRVRVNRPAEWCYMAHLLSQKNTNISTTRA